MTYHRGDFLVTCPISGFVSLRSEMKMRWDGLLVHESEWNPRQPQDTLRPKPEKVYTNTGLDEQADQPQPTYNSAIPITRDNGGSGSFTDYTVTPTDSGYIAATAGTFTYDNNLRYSSFKGAGIGEGGITFVVYSDGVAPTMAIGVVITNDGGNFSYILGNVITSDKTADTPFTGYVPGDELSLAVNAGVGDYGAVYLYRNGSLVDTHTLTAPLTATPDSFGYYFPLLGAQATWYLVQTPEFPISGGIQYATQQTLTFDPDELGI